jgi:hypothetical protein
LTQDSKDDTFPSIMSPQNRSFSTATAQSRAKDVETSDVAAYGAHAQTGTECNLVDRGAMIK